MISSLYAPLVSYPHCHAGACPMRLVGKGERIMFNSAITLLRLASHFSCKTLVKCLNFSESVFLPR